MCKNCEEYLEKLEIVMMNIADLIDTEVSSGREGSDVYEGLHELLGQLREQYLELSLFTEEDEEEIEFDLNNFFPQVARFFPVIIPTLQSKLN